MSEHEVDGLEPRNRAQLLFYLDCSAANACAVAPPARRRLSNTKKSEWAQDENLILMTRKRLWRLAAPIGRRATVAYTGLRLGPLSSNLYLAFH